MPDIITRKAPVAFDAGTPQRQLPPITYSANTPNSREIFGQLRRRKLLIALVALLVIVPAAILTYRAKPVYVSSALIQINPDPVQVLPYRDVADSTSGVYFEVYMSTQDQILRSPNLIERVATSLQSEPHDSELYREAAFLGQRFQVRRVPNSQLFQISYRASSSATAAQVVNLFAKEYLRQHVEARQATRERARESLQKELEELEHKVESSEKGLVNYARRENIVNAGPGQGDLVQKRMSGLDSRVFDAQNEVALAQNKLESVQKISAESLPEKMTTPELASLTSRLLQAEHDLAALRTNFGENWPAVVAKRDEIALLNQQLTRERKTVLSQASEQAQLDLQAAQGRLKSASGALSEQKGLVDRYNDASIEYNILQREVETNQKLYEGLLERLSQTNLQGGFEFGGIQLVEAGEANNQIESPNALYNLSLASLMGLTLGIGAAFLRGFWDNSVSTLEEVQELTRLPGLGTVPSSKFFSAPDRKVPPNRRKISVSLRISTGAAKPQVSLPPPEIAEAIRDVCASILLSQSDRPPRVIAVSSALPGEGKTTVAREIGRALAESGARTLLVEADLRRPTLAEYFGIGQGDGLSLFLSGHAASPRICETDQPNLFVAPAGPAPPNPVALLGSEKMAAFLLEMGAAFKFILLDTPPVLAVADARIIGSQADGLVLVSRARHTSKSLILRARAILQSSGINILGLVLNDAETDDFPSVYYYKPKA
jgi:capsular exopolysaccharide synthesis family protein